MGKLLSELTVLSFVISFLLFYIFVCLYCYIKTTNRNVLVSMQGLHTSIANQVDFDQTAWSSALGVAA